MRSKPPFAGRASSCSIKSSDWWDDVPFLPSITVEDLEGPGVSKILGPDGKPIPYEDPRQGFIGFFRTKERRS